METVSKYKNNVIAKKSRVFFSTIMEYGLVFVSSLLIFYLTLLGATKLPVSTQNVEKYNNTALKAKKYINTTHLLHYDIESGSVRDINVDARNYVISLVKTSAYVYDLAYPVEKEDSTYDTNHKVEVEETFINDHDNYPLDNVSFFWMNFFPNNDFGDADKTPVTAENIFSEKMGFKQEANFVSNFVTADTAEFQTYKDTLPIYSVLTKDNTSALINVIVYEDTTNKTASDLYENLKIGYKNGIQSGIDMVETKSAVYLEYAKDFRSAYNAIALLALIAYVIAFIVGYVAVVFIARAMAGSFITLSQKALTLGLARKDEMNPKAKNLVIYHIVNAFIYFSSMIIALYFTGYVGVMNLPLFGPFNVFAIEIASLVFLVASIVILIVTKSNQTLGLLLSNMVVKDVKEFETAVVDGDRLLNQEKPKEDGNNN